MNKSQFIKESAKGEPKELTKMKNQIESPCLNCHKLWDNCSLTCIKTVSSIGSGKNKRYYIKECDKSKAFKIE